MLVLVGLVLGAIFGFISFKGRMVKQFMTASGEPSQTVSTITTGMMEWLPKLEAVGTLRAVHGVDLSAEVSGLVSAIYFKQGDQVKTGDILLQIRADDEQAKLKSLVAVAQLARITYKRSQAQFNVMAISRQTLDNDRINLEIAQANVVTQQALLDKKKVRAPFAGRLGMRVVDPGQYLEPGAPIATLQALDPIFIDFFLPQQALASLKIGQIVTLVSDAYPGIEFNGEISVINPKIDVSTRNLQVRASLKNPEQKLLPGMYATVNIATGDAQRHITIPRTAIAFNPYGATVYIVDKSGKDAKGNAQLIARQSFVTTGESRGDQIAVLKGINEGDEVVTSGQIKLHNGSPIIIDNSVQPSNNAAPQPIDQ